MLRQQADRLEQLADARPRIFAAREIVHAEHLTDRVADRHARIE
jgi:hypothetical protein